MYYVLFFFFFQAEDGIRDWSVTGVQTCALPICRGGILRRRGPAYEARELERRLADTGMQVLDVEVFRLDPGTDIAAFEPVLRSEERRVGKECRGRWARRHQEERHVWGTQSMNDR